MKKTSLLYDDQIDLIALSKLFWDGKIKILLITIISFLVGFVYNFLIPINYTNLLTISPPNTKFLQLDNIQNLLKTNQSLQINQSTKLNLSNQLNQSNLARFINELEDYEEFLLSIQNTKKIQKNISKLNVENKEEELFKYAKLLEIQVPKKKNNQRYILNFKWHDPAEAKKILENALNLTSKNLKKRIDLELEQNLDFKKKLLLNSDKTRLDYLKEQSAIAKELNIVDNQIENINLSQSSVSLNINTADIAYYLRGFKAIDKEIELIENRDYQNLRFIEEEINFFKKQNIKFADYNTYLIDVKPLKNTNLILAISILLGLLVGIFYVIISNVFNQKISKKIT